MNKSKVSLIRLYSGEHIIGKFKDLDYYTTTLADPRVISLMPSMSGQAGFAFRPVCMFSKKPKKDISLRHDQVMVKVSEDELPKELVNGYLSEVSGDCGRVVRARRPGKRKAGRSFSS